MNRSVHRPDGRRIEAEIRTTATPEEVWKAWTDPSGISSWFTDDARRIPVKAQMKSDKGTATFILTKLDEGQQAIGPTKPPEAVADDDE